MTFSFTGKSILILDENHQDRQVLKKILENVGVRVFEAAMVKEALELAKSHSPNLIIADPYMSYSDFRKFYLEHNQDHLLTTIPIMVASKAKKEKITYCLQKLGIEYFLEKPLNARNVLSTTQLALKNTSAPCVEFAEGKRIKASFLVVGSAIGLGETGLRIELPMKINSSSRVELSGGLIQKMKKNKILFGIDRGCSRYSHDGQYYNQFEFVGVSDNMAMNVRKLSCHWERLC